MTKKMRIHNSDGDILARDNFVIVFFGKRPFFEMADGASETFEHWLKLVPKDMLNWAIIGKNTTKYTKVTPKALDRCRAMLKKETAKKKDIYFELMGTQPYGPDYRAILKGYIQPKQLAFADETNLIEFIFPREFCADYGEDRFVELVAELFDVLSCDSGYAAPALHYGVRGNYDKAGEFITPLALHHHGFDVPNNVSTAVSMGEKCRGARWLTMLSHKMTDQLGGVNHLESLFAEGVEVKKLSQGILIRAGSEPEIGDINKRQLTPLLSSVAHAIEDITYFHDNSLLPIFDHNEEKRDRWERRFWWDKE